MHHGHPPKFIGKSTRPKKSAERFAHVRQTAKSPLVPPLPGGEILPRPRGGGFDVAA